MLFWVGLVVGAEYYQVIPTYFVCAGIDETQQQLIFILTSAYQYVRETTLRIN